MVFRILYHSGGSYLLDTRLAHQVPHIGDGGEHDALVGGDAQVVLGCPWYLIRQVSCVIVHHDYCHNPNSTPTSDNIT